ncbi:MAG: hypothetical protein ACR2GB_02710 [Nocardioidaceae bacterium]
MPFTVDNPNPYAVTLTGASGANFTVDAAHSGCNVASLSAGNVALTSRIAANGTLTGSTIVVQMSNLANNACQGAKFTFDITVVGASSN